MKIKNWSIIEESTPGTMLEPGGYVCRITDVEDVPGKEYLWVVYDVIEGPRAGVYAGMGRDESWKHRFTRSYKDSAEGMFKGFLNRLEESNRVGPRAFKVADWERTGDERALIGLELGLVFGKEHYTNDRGEDKERTVVVEVKSSPDIRNGEFKVPEPRDRREKAPVSAQPAPVSAYDESIPF